MSLRPDAAAAASSLLVQSLISLLPLSESCASLKRKKQWHICGKANNIVPFSTCTACTTIPDAPYHRPFDTSFGHLEASSGVTLGRCCKAWGKGECICQATARRASGPAAWGSSSPAGWWQLWMWWWGWQWELRAPAAAAAAAGLPPAPPGQQPSIGLSRARLSWQRWGSSPPMADLRTLGFREAVAPCPYGRKAMVLQEHLVKWPMHPVPLEGRGRAFCRPPCWPAGRSVGGCQSLCSRTPPRGHPLPCLQGPPSSGAAPSRGPRCRRTAPSSPGSLARCTGRSSARVQSANSLCKCAR